MKGILIVRTESITEVIDLEAYPIISAVVIKDHGEIHIHLINQEGKIARRVVWPEPEIENQNTILDLFKQLGESQPVVDKKLPILMLERKYEHDAEVEG